MESRSRIVTASSFSVRVEAASGASFHNTLGTYQVGPGGTISDVHILAGDVRNVSGLLSVGGIAAGNQLGFFLVQDGANVLPPAVLGGGLQNVIIALSVATLPGYARVMNGLTLSIRENDYIMAGRSLGSSNPRVMFRHILPNAMPPMIVAPAREVPGISAKHCATPTASVVAQSYAQACCVDQPAPKKSFQQNSAQTLHCHQ